MRLCIVLVRTRQVSPNLTPIPNIWSDHSARASIGHSATMSRGIPPTQTGEVHAAARQRVDLPLNPLHWHLLLSSSLELTESNMVFFRPLRRTPRQQPLTHILRIPFLTHESYPHLRASIQEFADDPLVSTRVPREGIRSLEMLHVNIATLRLPTPDHLDFAWQLLNELSHNDWRALVQGRRDSNGIESTYLEQITSEALTSPFRVDLVGLSDGSSFAEKPRTPVKAMKLFVPIRDDTAMLSSFCQSVFHAFLAAGLTESRPSNYTQKEIVKLVDTTNVVWGNPIRMNTKTSKKTGSREWFRPESLKFDARPLLAKFHDRIWAKGIALERLAIRNIRQEGRMKSETFEGRRHSECMSVPLPGVSDSVRPRKFS